MEHLNCWFCKEQMPEFAEGWSFNCEFNTPYHHTCLEAGLKLRAAFILNGFPKMSNDAEILIFKKEHEQNVLPYLES